MKTVIFSVFFALSVSSLFSQNCEEFTEKLDFSKINDCRLSWQFVPKNAYEVDSIFNIAKRRLGVKQGDTRVCDSLKNKLSFKREYSLLYSKESILIQDEQGFIEIVHMYDQYYSPETYTVFVYTKKVIWKILMLPHVMVRRLELASERICN